MLNAYYILPLFNYSVASSSGIEYIINDVTSVLTSLSSRKRDITYSIQTFEKIIRKKDVLSNLLETIRLYEPNADMPDEFTKNLGPANQTFCLLSVEIDTSDIINIESLSIKETAKEMGLDVKVETNGQIGVENKLTKEDIERAAGIIVAADKKVEVARFNGRPTIMTKVADGINKPKELIQTI